MATESALPGLDRSWCGLRYGAWNWLGHRTGYRLWNWAGHRLWNWARSGFRLRINHGSTLFY